MPFKDLIWEIPNKRCVDVEPATHKYTVREGDVRGVVVLSIATDTATERVGGTAGQRMLFLRRLCEIHLWTKL